MHVKLEIIRGARHKSKGAKFEIPATGPDNITVGRSSRKPEKFGKQYPYIQISSDDLRLSRWHFMIQVRPPNCFISDMGSTNHTYLNDFKKDRHIKEGTELKDGDIIKAGRTYRGSAL